MTKFEEDYYSRFVTFEQIQSDLIELKVDDSKMKMVKEHLYS